jgi:uroporphyrinogen III methyltransferase/synthase
MTRVRKSVGRLTFVGSGPGDPELLSLRARDELLGADAVYADSGVPATIRATVPDELMLQPGDGGDAGKAALAQARAGSVTVRLVAGDPLADESIVREAAAAAKAGVAVGVVPALTLAAATASYAGVPLGPVRTEIDLRPLRGGEELELESLDTLPGSLVITVDAQDLPAAAQRLIAGGLKPDTAVTITCEGTGNGQHTAAGTLGEIELTAAGMAGALVITFGAPTKDRLGWWETRPLYGWRVLVPRTREQAGAMSERLRGYGGVPLEVPTIAVEPPRTPAQMERAIKGLVTGRYEWIIFTSTNAVRAVRERFEEFGLDARAFAGVKIAVVGEATADAVRAFGINPELVPPPEQQSSEGLLTVFPPFDDVLDPINRVLLPRADIATEQLAGGLREMGWEIDDVTAYRTVRAAPPPAQIRDAIKTGGFQAVCFTSSSTVRNLVGIAGKPHARTVVAVIGPQTAATAREFGLRVDVQPEVSTIPAMVDALAEFAVAKAEQERAKAEEMAARKAVKPARRR